MNTEAIITKMDKFFDEVNPDDIVQSFEKLGYEFEDVKPLKNPLLETLRAEISAEDRNIIDEKFLHIDLIHYGSKWLNKNGHENCSIVVSEQRCAGHSEICDIIGFNHQHSVMIEVKVSRSDFFKDSKKPHRSELGIGNFRFYLCTPDIISPNEVPDKWGLLYYVNGKIEVIVNPFHGNINSKSPNKFESNFKAERAILYSAYRKSLEVK